MTKPVPVFDGHNDFLLRLLHAPERREELWLKGTEEGQLDLPRMKAGGFAGGFFAIWVPTPEAVGGTVDLGALDRAMNNPPFAMPLPAEVPYEQALPVAMAEVGHLLWMERTGTLSICRSVADIRAAMAAGRIAAILHMEGAEAIGTDLDALHVWHAVGLRSLGPVWSRPTAFAHGVPFAFPSSPDTGDGLTGAGKDLVRECNRLKIMLDLSHLNEKGFDDIAAISDAPLVATHSNAHAVTPSSRNLTDRQLAMIRESRGMVGLNYAVGFLRPDGLGTAFEGWDPVLRHLDHLIAQLGEDHVGLGSDFDGATMPADLRDVAGLPRLLDALRAHGFGEELVEKIAHRNWLAVLGRVWGE
ncbi:membrane dipeptidase [Sinirhodobacter populi]|uniref:Membrane dipeptidase n=1 Tax=Paenirhodobacter populi TaxID=2306993 RepID=A0A443K146_9RHOB|nr:dipeptidase [Sinirhodobacter populi]RWR26473.1 membrane dipeptidase [Sinirhodobacter populi]